MYHATCEIFAHGHQDAGTSLSQGLAWDGTDMHLNIALRALRDFPPFIELKEPKG